jgi:hypothetical protein
MCDEEPNVKKRSAIQYTDEFAALMASKEVKKPKQSDKCVSIGIIGPSSKRKTNFESNTTHQLTTALFKEMVDYTTTWIEESFLQDAPPNDWSRIRLVSGGASWCDHVAVSIYLAKKSLGAKLTLYLPCELTKTGFFDSGKKFGALSNPGGMCNNQHEKFSATLGKSSLAELFQAIEDGATVNAKSVGFFAQGKALVHACDELLAFGWSDNGAPDTPGTAHTWKSAPPNVNRHYQSLTKLAQKPVK